ncbi:MAG: hypothetical protein P9L94_05125 [Candidatus Hinthialibacter antarcticus]|nr:hypothetical protein [Candidatus Hinthialibacter antarcticus]
MKKRILMMIALPALLAVVAQAQELTPVWEHTLIDGGGVLPILVNGPADPRWDGDPEDGPWYGPNLHDQYDGFIRYDDSRLLLGVRDNGIDETDPNHDAALAAQFPDRSIIWINPEDGSPMGVALEIGFKPVELSTEYESMIDGGSGSPAIEGWGDPKNRRFVSGEQSAPEYMNFDVDDDGVLYLGYWYTILRYDPDGAGGFTGPTVVYEQDYSNHGGTNRVSQWRFADIEVIGSGANTTVITSGKTWRNGMRSRVFDVDAATNTWTIRGAYGDTKEGSFGNTGGASVLTTSDDGEEVLYKAGNVSGSGVWRYYWDAGSNDFGLDPPDFFAVVPPADADGFNHALPDRFPSDVATHPDLDYLVVATSPAWASQNNSDTIDAPGFITAYSTSNDTLGEYISDSMFGATKERTPAESDELATNGNAVWNGLMSQVKVNILPGQPQGSSEVLYLSMVYGYGRYIIGEAPAPVSNWALY